MATIRQRVAIKKTIENMRTGGHKSTGQIMRESGYSITTADHPEVLTQSKAFEVAREKIDYARHIRELDQMASTANNEDKDNVLKGKDMLFKLGDKYPALKSKVLGLFQTLDSIEE